MRIWVILINWYFFKLSMTSSTSDFLTRYNGNLPGNAACWHESKHSFADLKDYLLCPLITRKKLKNILDSVAARLFIAACPTLDCSGQHCIPPPHLWQHGFCPGHDIALSAVRHGRNQCHRLLTSSTRAWRSRRGEPSRSNRLAERWFGRLERIMLPTIYSEELEPCPSWWLKSWSRIEVGALSVDRACD